MVLTLSQLARGLSLLKYFLRHKCSNRATAHVASATLSLIMLVLDGDFKTGVQVQREAMTAVQQDGIVFIDEIDKIVVNHETRYGMRPNNCLSPQANCKAGARAPGNAAAVTLSFDIGLVGSAGLSVRVAPFGMHRRVAWPPRQIVPQANFKLIK